MKIQSIDLRYTQQFPPLLLDYIDQKPELRSFYNLYPELDNFSEIIKQRLNFSLETRSVLVNTLNSQYEGYPDKPDIQALLDDKTFTVTTGHQLNIFGGPLYIIYKIITVINLARQLQEAYPDYRFIPVYWMATEDHDFQEIASVSLSGKKYTWKQHNSGAVGRLEPSSITELINEMPEVLPVFRKAYGNKSTLADAVRCYMHHLFGHEGLICLDADNSELKRVFLPVMKDELLKQVSGALVEKRTQQIKDMGYSLPVNAREINLFYLNEQLRSRIVREDDNLYKVLDTDISFTTEELMTHLEEFPERFSPNVVLRPLYEEVILPNLAYIGGPSEIPYWLQLKSVFDYYNTTFPLLIPRKFGLYFRIADQKKMDKLGLKPSDFFNDKVKLKKDLVRRLSETDLSMDGEKEQYQALFANLIKRIKKVDPTLEYSTRAEEKKLFNALERLEKRLLKAEEKKHSKAVEQLNSLIEYSFPGGTAQERKTNFQEFYLSNRKFISELLDVFRPLDFNFEILLEYNEWDQNRASEDISSQETANDVV